MGITLPVEMKLKLEQLSSRTGHSVGMLIRIGVEKLFNEVETTGQLSQPVKKTQVPCGIKKQTGAGGHMGSEAA